MRVCVYVCMYLYVFVCICMYMCVCVCMCMYVYVCLSVCMYVCVYVCPSADHCRQQGERVRGGLTSNKGRREKIVTFGTLGCRPRARSVLHCHSVLALREDPVTGAVQDASFSPAGGSFDRSCAGRKPAARGRRQVGRWQCRKASKWKV